jgi:phospholipid/cholesterol/gamma-HCH transport system substrate-binding protein
MIKETPSFGRIMAMVLFALSVFCLLLFLWLTFGGSIPLKPQGYRFDVHIPEAATLANESDVRLAGVNVGKVKKKSLDKGGARTKVEIEMDSHYAPIPKDSRVMLRQKTLLGETYVEISEGHKSAGYLKDGGTLANTHVEPTVELDEIFSAFDPKTRKGFQDWMKELARAIRNGRSQDLNDAFGNLPNFATDATRVLKILDEQKVAVRQVFRNTGEVFEALTKHDDSLRHLIVNQNNTFDALARADNSLAEAFRIFPTFLDEGRVTADRLERFSRKADPWVRLLRQPAHDLGPTLRDLGKLSPDLISLFRKLDRLRVRSRGTVPQLSKVVEGLEPVFEQWHPFFQEFNPILSMLNYHQTTVAGFLSLGAADTNARPGGRRAQVQFGPFTSQSFAKIYSRTDPANDWSRGNSYTAPNALLRAFAFGIPESFDCIPSGQKTDPTDAEGAPNIPGPTGKAALRRPPCFVAPTQMWDNKKFPYPKRGQDSLKPRPPGIVGNSPARDPHPNDPLH